MSSISEIHSFLIPLIWIGPPICMWTAAPGPLKTPPRPCARASPSRRWAGPGAETRWRRTESGTPARHVHPRTTPSTHRPWRTSTTKRPRSGSTTCRASRWLCSNSTTCWRTTAACTAARRDTSTRSPRGSTWATRESLFRYRTTRRSGIQVTTREWAPRSPLPQLHQNIFLILIFLNNPLSFYSG